MSNPPDWDNWGIHVIESLERLSESQSKLDSAMERLSGTQADINATLERNTVILDEHMRRTEAAEKALELLKQEIEPVKTHVTAIKLLIKIGGVTGTIVGVVLGILKFMSEK